MIRRHIDSHTTPTFANRLNLANSENLKVIPFMYDKIDVLDYDAATELLNSIYEIENSDSTMSDDFTAIIGKPVPGVVYISKINDKQLCLNTFD